MHITSDSKQAENTYCSPSSPSIPQFQPWRSSNPRTCRRRWPLHLGLPSRWRPTGDLWQPMLKCCAYIAVWSCLTQGCFPDLAVVRYRKSPTLGFWSQRNVSWDSMWVKCDIHIHSQHMWAVPQMGVPQNKLVMSYNGKFRGTPILGNPWKPPCVWPEFVQSLCQGPGVFLGLAGCLPRCVRRTDGLVWRGRSWARACSFGWPPSQISDRRPSTGGDRPGLGLLWISGSLKKPSNTNGSLRLYYDMACKRLLTWLQIDLNWSVFYGDL